ncbi:CHAT domain-containing protein [Nostoc sp. UHCC 0870]|uniref:CHAT domain-containing protein n=1 Tax=Nostoc sp. UHCC 0870 TaxID=2914041 RepID=UPI001EE08E04|nr:CHAT domain-containing protein [Nostoc sp. UHCC 0870]UKO97206.1 CHAT domain-containing protein [Nostoc sp. UHCC 0870]
MMLKRHHLLGWLFLCSLIFNLVINQIFITDGSMELAAARSLVKTASVLSKVNTKNDIQPASGNLKENRGDVCIDQINSQSDNQGIGENFRRQSIGNKLSLVAENIRYTSNNLNSAIADIGDLQMIEIEKYYGRNCHFLANSQRTDLSLSKTNTAIFHSIILEERTAIIVSFPRDNQRLKLQWINVNSQAFREEVNQFRISLENYANITYNPQQAQKLYNWIIRPFINDLESLQIKTLVFIQDGILRSVPMAALHDGEKFLVEKYAIATTPSLNVTNLQTSRQKKARALAVGLTKDAIIDGRRFHALKNVRAEINQVKMQIPGSKQLLDEDFTRDRLQSELSQNFYPIIHIATHGQFGELPNDTFLVTGDNQKLTISELDRILRSIYNYYKYIDLLVLTACETAIGNDRAALGLAGVAVQAGVKTALASLWSINDASTVKLVTKFYEAWYHSGVSKAEALRIAQRSLIASDGVSSHPAYWAAFILVGNWL